MKVPVTTVLLGAVFLGLPRALIADESRVEGNMIDAEPQGREATAPLPGTRLRVKRLHSRCPRRRRRGSGPRYARASR
jgi:hypothetical protein